MSSEFNEYEPVPYTVDDGGWKQPICFYSQLTYLYTRSLRARRASPEVTVVSIKRVALPFADTHTHKYTINLNFLCGKVQRLVGLQRRCHRPFHRHSRSCLDAHSFFYSPFCTAHKCVIKILQTLNLRT